MVAQPVKPKRRIKKEESDNELDIDEEDHVQPIFQGEERWPPLYPFLEYDELVPTEEWLARLQAACDDLKDVLGVTVLRSLVVKPDPPIKIRQQPLRLAAPGKEPFFSSSSSFRYGKGPAPQDVAAEEGEQRFHHVEERLNNLLGK